MLRHWHQDLHGKKTNPKQDDMISLTSWETLTLCRQYVQANVVSTERRIDRLEDELPSHGQFRDCSEQIPSQPMGAITALRARGNTQHERLHQCLLYIRHTRTPTSLRDTRKWKRQLFSRMRPRLSLSVSPLPSSIFCPLSSFCSLVSSLSL